MVFRKVMKTNSAGALSVNIPADYNKKVGLTSDSFVSIELEGETLKITKARCLK